MQRQSSDETNGFWYMSIYTSIYISIWYIYLYINSDKVISRTIRFSKFEDGGFKKVDYEII